MSEQSLRRPGRDHVAELGAGHGPFVALRFRDFRILWFGLVIASTAQPLQFFVQTWFIVTSADESVRILLLGVLGAMRGLAMLTFGMFGGALADRFDRRRLLLTTQSIAIVLSLLMALLLMNPPASQPLLFGAFFTLAFSAAALQSIDLPTRQALTPRLVPPAYLPQAIALTAMAMQFSQPVSLFIAGRLIDLLGLGTAYLLTVGGYLVVIGAVLLLRSGGGRADTRRVSVWGNVRDGIRYARGNRPVLGVLVVIYVISGLGMPLVSVLGAAWFRDVLGLSASGWSSIAVFWGTGAIIASVTLASLPNRRRQGLTFFLAAIGFGIGVLIFGLVRWLPAVAAMYAVIGGLLVVVQVSATTLIQSLVPNRVMGRMMSLLQLGQGFSQLNGLGVAVFAQRMGLELTIPLLGASAAAAACILALMFGGVRRIDRTPNRTADTPAPEAMPAPAGE
jgi:MFS family permease